ncbi:methyltransferase [Mesoplasma corruscae]|uniref:Methyltransferase n=2 Tax=Mesoplasma corruscae TaxID=216874 RepID=A0A2S5RH34_9MOLU|nr:methyltransferase [Mesoplasma corruscae]
MVNNMFENKNTYYGDLASFIYNLSKPPGTSIDGDIEFYTNELIQYEGRVLEAGVGNGRMAIPLLRKGVDVFGIDNSLEMIELYKTNLLKYNLEANVELADLNNLKLTQKFESIILPNGSFCLLKREYSKNILMSFLNLLQNNGKLYIDLIYPNSFKAGIDHEYNFKIENDKFIKIKNSSISINWIEQSTFSVLKYDLMIDNKSVQQEIQNFKLYWYGVDEFEKLLLSIGFKNIKQIINYNNKKMLNLKTLTFIAEK